ncbi:hypothetical protein C7405_11063 [Paraburkholderia caballeronis]|uniref:DUF1993 domain-containing protein n=1 Tax=Paraburkholderia caballeronis TaxID=416943 RepID=UPI0010DAAE7B|nr:DUF1993 domain-containing protein [Paraburkholderia caballeronis]TDV33812.1 hypothetical protein C7405_11063 [Paraburkholderia caballeronis]
MNDASIDMYDVSISTFRGGFRTLAALLAKAEADVAAGRFEETALLEARLADDMDPLRRQIQHASDAAKACAMRLAGRSVPRIEDNERTLSELRERIARTEALLDLVSRADLIGSGDRVIKVNLRRRWVSFDGRAYLLEFALPNFFFHVTTAYAILRHMGLDIGKLDYLVDVARRRQAPWITEAGNVGA